MTSNTALLTRLRQNTFLTWACATALIGVIVFAIPEPPRIRIAIHQGIEGVALKMAAVEFAKTGMSVTIDDLPYDRLYQLALKELSQSASNYDVFMVDDPWMPALAYGEKDNRLLAPVQLANDACGPKGFVASTLMVARNVRVPYNMAQPSCSGDTFYGVPYVGNSQLFVHKKSRTAPQKWENLWNDTGYFLRSGPGNPIVTDFMPMLWARSTDSFQLDTSEGLQLLVDAMPALDDLRRLGARERLNLSITSYDDLDLAIHMVRGSATASIVWSAWAMAMDTHARGQLEFTGLPEEGTPELGVWLLTIPANSNRRKDAQKFLDFATTYDALLTAARHGNPPPRTDVLESQTYRELVSFSDKQLESLSKARPRPRTRYWKQVETVLGRCLSNIYESPEADANRILENANAGIKKVLGSSDEFARNDVVDGFTCQ